jgi:threonylcarbamoyladenosine tRNA methylthiotransferase MtaB
MKRKYNADQALSNMERLRQAMPKVRYTTDIIVGFPGESEEDFIETLEFAKKANFLMIHVFPYSARKGTPAAKMGNQIPQDIKKQRSAELIALEKGIRAQEFNRILAQNDVHTVLFESYENGFAYGHTPDFLEVSVKSDKPLHSCVLNVKLISHNGETFFAEIVDKQ